nr:hypothetical protein [Tanacetum cinerariifolium]
MTSMPSEESPIGGVNVSSSTVFAVNRESARDVYSKQRIIAITELKIVEWHNYKHLDWITVRRDDDKLYKFKEGDFKRLHIQDIEDMSLLIVQGKLTNLIVDERFAFNVSLRMFTRSIVIQRHVEDLQLEGSTWGYPLASVEVLRYDKRSKSEYMGIVPTKMELILEHTQQGPQDTNGNAGTQDNIDAGKEVSDQHYIVLPLWSSISSTFKSSDDKAADDKPKDDTGSKTTEEPINKEDQAYKDELDRLMSQEKEASGAADALRKESEQGCMDQRGATEAGSTNPVNTVSNPVNVVSTSGTFSTGGPSSPHPDTFIPANTLLHACVLKLGWMNSSSSEACPSSLHSSSSSSSLSPLSS